MKVGRILPSTMDDLQTLFISYSHRTGSLLRRLVIEEGRRQANLAVR